MTAMRKIFQWVFAILVVGAIFLFATQNSQTVEIRFFRWSHGPKSVALYMFLSFSFGMVLAGLLALKVVIALKNSLRKSRKAQESLETEIDSLRNQPIYDSAPRSNLPSAESTILEPADS